jgi:hypothetical protein
MDRSRYPTRVARLGAEEQRLRDLADAEELEKLAT